MPHVLIFLPFFLFSAAGLLGIFGFSPQARTASVVTAPLAKKAIFAVMLFSASLIRHRDFARHTGDSNKCHFHSE
jgi:hypothetical protein